MPIFSAARGCGKDARPAARAGTLLRSGGGQAPLRLLPRLQALFVGNHPDVRALSPKGRSIGVDDVRELIDYLSRRPYEGGWHVAIIERAEKMTPSAQNALLKTLENPPEDTVFFLLTETPGALLSTVRSRARLVRVSPLTREACAEALVRRGVEAKRAARLAGLAHGSVGRALELGSDAGFEALLARSLTSLAALKGHPASVAEAAAPFYEERERQEDLLEIFEIIGRDRMALENGVAPEALTEAGFRGVRVDGRKLLLSVLAARRMLSANVAWPNALDALYLSLV